MNPWRVEFTRQAAKDARRVADAGLKPRVERLLAILRQDPFQSPPLFEKLVGDMAGAYSRRITIQHRLVYEIDVAERMVRVIRMWTHYE